MIATPEYLVTHASEASRCLLTLDSVVGPTTSAGLILPVRLMTVAVEVPPLHREYPRFLGAVMLDALPVTQAERQTFGVNVEELDKVLDFFTATHITLPDESSIKEGLPQIFMPALEVLAREHVYAPGLHDGNYL